MGWERVITQIGRGETVTVSWRVPGGRTTPALAVSLSKSVCEKLNLRKNQKGEPVQRVFVDRDKLAGKIRIGIAPPGTSRHECRHVAWKDGGCTVSVPLDDVKLTEKKPAQDVSWEISEGWLVVKLPHWACPIIKVTGKAA